MASRGASYVSKLAIVAMILLAAFGNGQPLFAEGQYLNARCVRGLATGAGVLNAGRPALSDSPSASVNERDFRIEIPRETAAIVATPLPLLSCGLLGEIDCV
jgi:hypothetical protein